MTLLYLLSLSVALLLVLYYRFKNLYSYWDKRGVKGPRPLFLFGHFLDLLNNGTEKITKKWAKEYGRVFGIYEGTEPVLAIADAEVVRQICIRDFDVFPNHWLNKHISDLQRGFIFSQRDNQWRRIRALMSPTFTSGKMRRMVELLDRCVDDLLASFDEQLIMQGQTSDVNLKDIYSLYTLDAITTCCYALKLERVAYAKDLKTAASRNELVKDAMKLFQFSYVRLALSMIFSAKLLKWFKFELFPSAQQKPIMSKVSNIIDNRRISKRKFDDYLQLLIEAKLDDQIELDELDCEENHHAALSNKSIKMDQEKLVAATKTDQTVKNLGFMSNDEVLSNAMFLMIVGLETTSNLLTCCTYALAFHREVQDRLRQEVKAITNVGVDYDSITTCQYLDAVISETLRIMSPIMMTDRSCDADYHIEKYNITVPKGLKVILFLDDIMNDEENWHEPAKFDPNRFMPDNRNNIVPGSYCPFGLGPRHCIGMRFSLTESKLALAKLITNYEFTPAERTRFPPEISRGPGFRQLKNPRVCIRRVPTA